MTRGRIGPSQPVASDSAETRPQACFGSPERSSRTAHGGKIETHDQGGRAARERPRPGTREEVSHAGSKYLAHDGLDSFVGWFVDWSLRRGRELPHAARGGE